MKKFLAIVMCLAMALSMMTVVSFAAGEAATLTLGTVSGEVGATVELPVSLALVEDANMVACDIVYDKSALVLKGITWDADITGKINTSLSNVDTANDPQTMTIMNAANFTYTGKVGTLSFEILEGASGDYTVSSTMVMAYDAIMTSKTAAMVNGTITVEAPVVTTPTVEATKVEAADEDGQPVALYILQPKNATEYGIKYVGENVEYNGKKFKSLAPAADAMAAVKVIGLDNAFEAYAE